MSRGEAATGASWDLAVVGAGIVGAMAAWYAVERFPDWRVLLLDRSEAGGGATRSSAGLDLPYGHNALRRELAAESLELYRDLRAGLPGLPIAELPLACVTARDRAEEHLARFVGPLPRLAGAAELVALSAAWPELRLGDDLVVLTGAICSRAQPAGVVHRLTARLRQAGAALWEGAEVVRLESAGEELGLDTADGRSLAARRVVLATGPWALSGPGSDLAHAQGIRIKKVAALHLDRLPAPDQPVVLFLDDDAFLLPLADRGQVLFSFRCEVWGGDPDAGRPSISKEDRRQGLECLARWAPALVRAAHGGRAFYDAYGPDRSPVVAADPDLSGVVLAGAGSGSGYRLAPAIARRALDALPAAAGRRPIPFRCKENELQC